VKVRRLGYIVALTNLVWHRQIPLPVLVKEIERWSDENEHHLADFCKKLPVVRRRGIPITGQLKKDDSARRYIAAAEEMGFLTRVTGGYQNTKAGEVLSSLPREENPFKLTLSQKHLIFKHLLVRDHDYLVSLLAAVIAQSEGEEWSRFQTGVMQIWKKKVRMAKSQSEYLALHDAFDTIRSWKRNPKRHYHEDIKATRIEWLLDLGLAKHWNQTNNSVDLRQCVKALLAKDLLDSNWIENNYTEEFSRCYDSARDVSRLAWSQYPPSSQDTMMIEILREAVTRFRPLESLFKISADQFFDFADSVLLDRKRVVASYHELRSSLASLSESKTTPFKYVETVAPADSGYILCETDIV